MISSRALIATIAIIASRTILVASFTNNESIHRARMTQEFDELASLECIVETTIVTALFTLYGMSNFTQNECEEVLGGQFFEIALTPESCTDVPNFSACAGISCTVAEVQDVADFLLEWTPEEEHEECTDVTVTSSYE
jgi:hypothetical protein